MNKRKLVLILDQNYNKALILVKRLEALGYGATIVNSAESVIEYLNTQKEHPDLILADVTAQNMSLLNLPEKIQKETGWGKLIPIAVHSALAENEIILKAIRNGFSDYIIRPIENEIFSDRIAKLIDHLPVLNETTFQKPIHEIGIIEAEMTIEKYNEFGAVILSPFPLLVDQMVILTSETINKLLGEKTKVRVVSCHHEMNSQRKYEAVVSYVGLTATQTRQLRQSVMFVQNKKTA